MRTLIRTVGRKSMGGEPLPSCSPCGSVAGYRLHTKERTQPCVSCKDARNAYRREHHLNNPLVKRESNTRYRETHREQVALGKVKYRETHVEQIKISRALHLRKNRNKINEYYKKYRRDNPEKVREGLKDWRKRNPEYGQVYWHIRRASELRVLSEPYTVQQILELWGDSCHICRGKINLSSPRRAGLDGWEDSLHLDHVVPVSRGGTNTKDNVKPSHALCNMKKHDLLMDAT